MRGPEHAETLSASREPTIGAQEAASLVPASPSHPFGECQLPMKKEDDFIVWGGRNGLPLATSLPEARSRYRDSEGGQGPALLPQDSQHPSALTPNQDAVASWEM